MQTLPIDVKFTTEPTGIIAGLASPFGGDPDTYGDVVAPGAFATTIASGEAIPMLWAHDQSRPVGRWTKLAETAGGLSVEGKLNLSTSAGREAFEHLKAGDVSGLSIGYEVPEGGAERRNGIRILKNVDLREVSLVAIPAARSARIGSVKSARTFASAADLKAALRELGMSRGAAELVVRGGWSALAKAPPETMTERIAALRAAAITRQRAAAGLTKGTEK